MIPPRYAKAVSVKNTSSHAVTVTAVFGSDAQAAEGNAKITKTVTLAPAHEARLGDEEYDMGGWTAVAALESLSVAPADANASGALGSTLYTPSVDSVVDTVYVEIQAPSTASAYHVALIKQD